MNGPVDVFVMAGLDPAIHPQKANFASEKHIL
jgi:hypothetical protein